MRSGTATVDAVQEIARQNREARDAYERDQYISNLDASDRTRKDTNDRLYQLTLETGDVGRSLGQLEQDIETRMPDNPYAQRALRSELDYLKRQKPEQLTSRFVNRYFDENKDEISNVIGQGVDYGEYSRFSGNPMITNTSVFRDKYNALYAEEEGNRKAKLGDKLTEKFSDANFVNMMGPGSLQPLMNELGPDAEKLMGKPQIEQRIQAQQQEVYRGRNEGYRKSAIEMSETVTNEAMEQTQGMFADMVKNIKDQTAAAQLMAFLNRNVASPGASVALMQDIQKEGGKGISQEKMAAVISKYSTGNAGFMSRSDYKRSIQDSYVQAFGGGEQGMDFATNFVEKSFGLAPEDRGALGKQTDKITAQTDKLDVSPFDFAKGNLPAGQVSLGSGELAYHEQEVRRALAEAARLRSNVDQSIQTLESERNFLATFDEDYAGLRQVGTAKGQALETELDKVLERLEERLAQIQVAQMTQQKRQNRQMMAEDYAGGPGLEMMLRFMANQPDKVKNAVRNGQLDSAVIDVLSRQAGLITKKTPLDAANPSLGFTNPQQEAIELARILSQYNF